MAGVPGFLAFLDLGARLPLAFRASALLSGGLAVQAGPPPSPADAPPGACRGPGDARGRAGRRDVDASGSMAGLVVAGIHHIRSAGGREEQFSLKAGPEERRNFAGLPEAQGTLRGFRGALRAIRPAASRD